MRGCFGYPGRQLAIGGQHERTFQPVIKRGQARQQGLHNLHQANTASQLPALALKSFEPSAATLTNTLSNEGRQVGYDAVQLHDIC